MTDDKQHWYVAYVRSCREKVAAEKLARFGYEYYLPIQRVQRQWSDRKKIIDKLVLPRMIFVHCTEMERRKSLELVNDLYKYITEKGPFTASIIRDVEMEAFREMVEKGGRDVRVVGQTVVPGDRVRIVSGPLEGLEVELISVSGTRCIAVHLGPIGTATIDLETDIVKKI